jgi:hypothetical protein
VTAREIFCYAFFFFFPFCFVLFIKKNKKIKKYKRGSPGTCPGMPHGIIAPAYGRRTTAGDWRTAAEGDGGVRVRD